MGKTVEDNHAWPPLILGAVDSCLGELRQAWGFDPLWLICHGTPTERALHSRDRRAAECPGMRGQNQAFAFFSRSIYHAIHLQSYQYNQYCTRKPGVPAMPEGKPEWKPDHEWVPEPSPRSTWTRRPPVASPGEQPAINFAASHLWRKYPINAQHGDRPDTRSQAH